MGVLRNLRRNYEFIRHIPTQQVLRRLYLASKRKLIDGILPSGRVKPWTGSPPRPIRVLGLHAPHGRLWRENGVWKARFLNDERALGSTIDWKLISEDARDQLWRMNLHYFEYLPDLSDAEATELIDSWIAGCRPRDRVSSKAAWTPYAVSLRISAWLDFLVRRNLRADGNFLFKLYGSLREQGAYLAANLETDIRGNHLIKNIRALTELSAAFADAAAPKWRKIADRVLARELEEQILPDGVHFERSPSYHCQVFADLMMIAANRSRHGLRDRLDTILDWMAQATVDLTHPDGFIAQFNDAGLNMAVTPAACRQAYCDLRQRKWPASRTHFAYADAGFYGARAGDDYFIVKLGPLGPNALMAHAHGDWGSFEWSVAGKRLAVDQGVYEYVEGALREASRSTTCHNTAVVDGAEQAGFFGTFRCGGRSQSTQARYVPRGDGFIVECELMSADNPGKVHQYRRVELTGRRLRIEDRAPAGCREIVSRILLHPAVAAGKAGEELQFSCPDGLELRVQLGTGQRLSIENGEWWPDMGTRETIQRVIAAGVDQVLIEVSISAKPRRS
jgi:hypothetical protein